MIKNRLTIIGNGFDLAHGLNTGYGHFLFWYFTEVLEKYSRDFSYEDPLIKIVAEGARIRPVVSSDNLQSISDILTVFERINKKIEYKIPFFRHIVTRIGNVGWVDIEVAYFKSLKSIFNHPSIDSEEKRKSVNRLNAGFRHLTNKLIEYIIRINKELSNQCIPIDNPRLNIRNAFKSDPDSQVLFLNFNYTETLIVNGYSFDNECLFIHGRASDVANSPIIFGYGDESDPDYQRIEDSGENMYMEHLKSFGYFKTDKYQKLLSFIDDKPYDVFIVGHSCGLSDRVLLNEIFEHNNCNVINIFYHRKQDGSDNFEEITQEISRHFRPINKNKMRRKVQPKDPKNIIPQVSRIS